MPRSTGARRARRRQSAPPPPRVIPPDAPSLADLSRRTGLPAPIIDADGAPHDPRRNSFAFPAAGVRGVIDGPTGAIVGLRMRGATPLSTWAWGTDEWFLAEFGAMTPPPGVVVVGPGDDASRMEEDLLGDCGPGTPETVFRLEFEILASRIAHALRAKNE